MMPLDPNEMKRIIARMKRANGHLASVITMMEEGSDCEAVLIQFAAVNRALSRAGYAIVATGMETCIADGDGIDSERRARLEKLFLALA